MPGLTKRQRKRLIGLLVSIALFAFGYIQSGGTFFNVELPVPAGNYRVIQIEDGDTITIAMNGTEERVRMIGVDTPETQDPRKPVQCFGYAASTYTRQLIGSNSVRLESDPLSQNRDRYNRLLRYIYLPDGRLVQAEIIKSGYGFAYTSFPFAKLDEFVAYQKEAREQNRGLWASCSPEPNQYGGFDANPE